jgi:hypothetical protein
MNSSVQDRPATARTAFFIANLSNFDVAMRPDIWQDAQFPAIGMGTIEQ